MAFQIALDGPAGAGKSSIAKAVARRLNMNYLDTGAMYRCLGLKAYRLGIDPQDEARMNELLLKTEISVDFDEKGQHNFLDGEKVDEAIRQNEISYYASEGSKHLLVRETMAQKQRDLSMQMNVILDGRDIGTYVLPQAPCKIYLTAEAEERARRRQRQLQEQGQTVDFDQLCEELCRRDFEDSQRKIAPLKVADDAVVLDSTHMTFDEVVDRVCEIAKMAGLGA